MFLERSGIGVAPGIGGEPIGVAPGIGGEPGVGCGGSQPAVLHSVLSSSR